MKRSIIATIWFIAVLAGCGSASSLDTVAERSDRVTSYVPLSDGTMLDSACLHRVPSGANVTHSGSTYTWTTRTASGSFSACTSPRALPAGAANRLIAQSIAYGDLSCVLNIMGSTIYVPPAPVSRDGQAVNYFFGAASQGPTAARVGILLSWGGDWAMGNNLWIVTAWSTHSDGTTVIGPDLGNAQLPVVNEGDRIDVSISPILTSLVYNFYITIKRTNGVTNSYVFSDKQDSYMFDRVPGEIYDSGVVRCDDYPRYNPERTATGTRIPGEAAWQNLAVWTTDITVDPWVTAKFTGPWTFGTNGYPCHFAQPHKQWGSPTLAIDWNWWE